MTTQKHPEQQYLDLMRDILVDSTRQEDQGTGDVTHSVFGRQMRWDLSEGFPLLTTKKVYWKGVLEELYWFWSGQSNVAYLAKKGVHIWDDYPYRIYREKIDAGDVSEMTKEIFVEKLINDDDFAKEHGELKNIYGQAWRRWPAKDGRGVDQLKWAIEELRKDPNCHNAIVNSWNPEYLYDMALPEESLRFPICHNMYQLSIQKEKVCCQLYQRSADIFLGVPFNIASYALLTALVAKVLGREPGEFIHTFGDVHIYDNHIDQVKEQLTREPLPLPTITISDDVKDIDDFRPEHITLEGYESHAMIKAKLAVVGGKSSKEWKEYVKKQKSEKKT